jgi:hypothetical protein
MAKGDLAPELKTLFSNRVAAKPASRLSVTQQQALDFVSKP